MPIDYKKYQPNWKTEIVPAILSRAENKCECCGLSNKQTVWSVRFFVREAGKYKQRSFWFRCKDDAVREGGENNIREITVCLTISHTDHDETNHNVSMDRLKALCQICHLRYDAKEKYRRIMTKNTNNG